MAREWAASQGEGADVAGSNRRKVSSHAIFLNIAPIVNNWQFRVKPDFVIAIDPVGGDGSILNQGWRKEATYGSRSATADRADNNMPAIPRAVMSVQSAKKGWFMNHQSILLTANRATATVFEILSPPGRSVG
ncbi:hypothetical protein [Mesorhizobium sp. KR9-304]|uniref:hypothetical protein n=1 Tax=Mesorhizobium sp. KR9-304 TaxID=3156614 RepID=UPI0032B3CA3A